MGATLESSRSWNVLTDVITGVRNRWRIRVALRGIAIVLAVALLTMFVGAWAMQLLHFTTTAVISIRVVMYAVLGVVAVRYLIMPLRQRPSDRDVALYLEQHQRSLDAVVVSAVDAGSSDAPAFVRSPRLVDRLIDSAAARVATHGNGTGIETQRITSTVFALAAMLVAGVLIVRFGPEFLRTGGRLLAAPAAAPARHVFIGVKPGNAKVSRHGDQTIVANAHGFSTDQAVLMVQRGDSAWQRLPMSAIRDSSAFLVRLFDLRDRTTYYVEANGIRSPTYHLDIVNLPYVQQLALEYRYPVYTGLSTRTVTNGGDIAAPQGTSVVVHATTTMPVKGGRIAIEGRNVIPMTMGPDGSLAGTIPVNESGVYKIELEAPNGQMLRGSLDYTIDVIHDNDPTIAFLKPGGDQSPMQNEDVFSQIQATDDYGIASAELRYSINGGPEKIASLHTGPTRKEVVAGYTFMLQQLGAKDGDIVSYYAQATDNDAIHGGKVAKTDIFFLNVRAPKKKKNGKKGDNQDQNQDQKGQQQKGPKPGALVRRQREIIVGTFKVDRDRARMTPDMLRENLATLSLAQNRLRQDGSQLAQRILERGLADGDSLFQIIVDEMAKADKEMQQAEGALNPQEVRTALSPEQRALKHLQRADAIFKSMQQQQQSQQSQSDDEPDDQEMDEQDLADLFDVKKDQMSQQYEKKKQQMPKQPPTAADSALKKLAEKLKELAQRQEAQAKQQEKQEQQGQQSASDGGEQQRKIAQETQQAAQKLDQLSGQQSNNRMLRQGAQQLKDAAKMMQYAASGMGSELSKEALSQLNEVQQQVDRQLLDQQPGAKDGKADANQKLLEQAHDLVQETQSLQDRVKQNQQRKSGMQQSASGGTDSAQSKSEFGQSKSGQPKPDQSKLGQSKSGQPKPEQSKLGQSKPGQLGSDQVGSSQSQSDQQIARDYEEQSQMIEGINRQLGQRGMRSQALDRAAEQMRELRTPGAYQTPDASRLAAEVAQGLQQWEYDLRKQLGAEGGSRPVLGGTNDVPSDFTGLVAEYYRALGKHSF